jgi:hypothetical protein
MKQLNQGLAGRLILVSAPAGFGKTTLVASWLRQNVKAKFEKEPGPIDQPSSLLMQLANVAWVSLDEAIMDPPVFRVTSSPLWLNYTPAWGRTPLSFCLLPNLPRLKRL